MGECSRVAEARLLCCEFNEVSFWKATLHPHPWCPLMSPDSEIALLFQKRTPATSPYGPQQDGAESGKYECVAQHQSAVLGEHSPTTPLPIKAACVSLILCFNFLDYELARISSQL